MILVLTGENRMRRCKLMQILHTREFINISRCSEGKPLQAEIQEFDHLLNCTFDYKTPPRRMQRK